MGEISEVWKWIAGLAVTLFVSVLGFVAREQNMRLKKLEEEKVDYDRFEKLHQEFKDHAKENNKSHSIIHQEVSEIRSGVARIEGFLKGKEK